MTELQQIETKIKELNTSLGNVKGSDCEVYTRIVGYYRSIRNFNMGQREAQKTRKHFKINQEEK